MCPVPNYASDSARLLWQDWAKQGLESAAKRIALKGYLLDSSGSRRTKFPGSGAARKKMGLN